MHVLEKQPPTVTPFPGLDHATWAGLDEGLKQLSVWRQTLAPGAATPLHRHDSDEVVLCLAGRGTLLVDGRRCGFGADSVLTLPMSCTHQILNTGSGALEIIGVFGSTPVRTFTPDGEPLPLPWRS